MFIILISLQAINILYVNQQSGTQELINFKQQMCNFMVSRSVLVGSYHIVCCQDITFQNVLLGVHNKQLVKFYSCKAVQCSCMHFLNFIHLSVLYFLILPLRFVGIFISFHPAITNTLTHLRFVGIFILFHPTITSTLIHLCRIFAVSHSILSNWNLVLDCEYYTCSKYPFC